MSPRVFSLTAGIVFLLITIAHIVRILSGAAVVVAGMSVPMWASGAAAFFMGYLAFEAFRAGRATR